MTADTAPSWDGRPLHPEADGWHWVVAADPAVSTQSAPWWWVAAYQHWLPPCDVDGAAPLIPSRVQWRYLGPCLTPSEVTAREAAAWAAGAAAMRVECERVVRNVVDTYELERILLEGFRALPLPQMPGTTQGGAGDE